MLRALKKGFFFLKRRCVYRWWGLPVFALFYFLVFTRLESVISADSAFHLIEVPLDRAIPFCEYFIIPYNIWFVYIMGTVTFFVLVNRDRREYYRFEATMIAGMSVFLLISALWPNGLSLRPEVFPRENFCTQLVRRLYAKDTPTNVFPSMHVYNSLCALIALFDCRMLRRHRWVLVIVSVLTVLIVLATAFLKQHSVLDVLAAYALSEVTYVVVYRILRGRLPVFTP